MKELILPLEDCLDELITLITLQELNLQNLVKMVEFFINQKGRLTFIFEYAENGDLISYIKQNEISEEEKLYIF